MKFNFDKIDKIDKVPSFFRKGVLIMLLGLGVNSLDAQEPVEKKTDFLYKNLQSRGLISISEEEFGKLPQEKIDEYFKIYVEARRDEHEAKGKRFYTSPEQAKIENPNMREIIRTSFVLLEVETNTSDAGTPIPPSFNFDKWFANQMELVRQGELKEGDSVQAPNGKWYSIRIDPKSRRVKSSDQNSNSNVGHSPQPNPTRETTTTNRITPIRNRKID